MKIYLLSFTLTLYSIICVKAHCLMVVDSFSNFLILSSTFTMILLNWSMPGLLHSNVLVFYKFQSQFYCSLATWINAKNEELQFFLFSNVKCTFNFLSVLVLIQIISSTYLLKNNFIFRCKDESFC